MTSLAFLLVLCSSIIHASWNLFAKKVSHNMTIAWAGMGLAAILLLPITWIILDSPHAFALAAYRSIPSGIIHAVYISMLLKGYSKWDISLIYPVSRGSAVALAALWTSIFLLQPKSAIGLVGIGLIIFGILTVGLNIKKWIQHEHHDPKHHHRGVLWALGIGCAISSYVTVDAFFVSMIHPIAYLTFMDIYMCALLIPYVMRHKKEDLKIALRDYKVPITYIGIASSLSYLLILAAFTMGAASYIVALRETSIIFVTIGGVLFLKEPLNKQKALGIALILLGAIFIKFA